MVQPCRPSASKPAAAAPGGKPAGGKKGGAPEFDGEYKLPLALGLGKQLKTPGLTPDAIAEEITKRLPAAAPGESPIARTSITAGFINVSVDRLWASRALAAWHTAGVPRAGQARQRVLVDFSSPNIAKDMHVGHLRSTIIGDAIARCLEFQGHDVLRVNHVGDWGTQFGMLIASLADSLSLPDPADATATDEVAVDVSTLPPIGDLVGVYREAKRRYDADAAFNAWAGRCVVALQAGGPRAVRLWRHICDASRAEFSATYSRLGARLEEVGESFYGKFIPAVVAELDAKGLTLESNGAKLMLPSVAKLATALDKKDVERLLFSYLLRPAPAAIRAVPDAAKALEAVDALAAAVAAGDAAAKGKEPEVLDKAAKLLSAKVTGAIAVAALREVGGQVAATVLRDGEGGLKVRVPIYSVPLMVVKTSGGFTYDTTDLAAAWYRTHPVGADRIVVVTDNGQETHFQLIAAAAAEAGWLSPERGGKVAEVTYEHVGFGLVLGADGKKIRTRAGETVKLRDLLDEAVAAARVEADSRNAPPAADAPAAKEDAAVELAGADEPAAEAAGPVVKRVERVPFTADELAANAEAIGVAAVKYFDLRQHRSTPYAFDAARMVALNGDTAARLLYAYVRIKSIGTAAGRVEADAVTYEEVIAAGVGVAVEDDAEWQLALHLLWLPSVLAAAAADLHVNRICEYLSQLVDRFSSFYSRVRVLSAPPDAKRQRLMLCATTALALEAGLSMLGIRTVQRM